jgi:hypothetical protein
MQIITAWHPSSPELTVNDFKKCCISSAMDENDDMLRNGYEGDGNVRSVTETKALTVKMGTVTLIGKGR